MSISFRASLKICAHQFVTRLLVIQGDFVYVTLAVYGDAALEPPLDQTSYEVTPLPDIFHHHLSPALDLANSKEPTLLSREIFDLMPDSPSLLATIRLIFCLKPVDGDPSPSIADCLAADVSGLEWLERAVEPLMTPVYDVSMNLLKLFAEKISEAFVEKVNHFLLVTGTCFTDACT